MLIWPRKQRKSPYIAYEYLELFITTLGGHIEVIEATETRSPNEESVDDLMAIIIPFSVRIYGKRGKKSVSKSVTYYEASYKMILQTTLRGTIQNLPAAADMALARTARIFQSARRTAYGPLNEGLERDDIDPGLRERFQLDIRFARDAILEAEATRDAMRKLIPDYLAHTKAKIAKVEARLRDYRIGKRQPKRATLEVTLGTASRSPSPRYRWCKDG
jgi:hypothetical protein